MQVQLPTRPTANVGAIQRSSFSMEDSAVALWVSAAQYSDQPWAIVREYTTNMVDAYVMLRRSRPDAEFIPPIITLPDALHPEICFTDFGIGMDYDTAVNTFPVYYRTPKAKDVKLIGGFGLGCKVANAYADQWTVEARFDGVIRIFSAYRREDGTQAFDMVHEGPTDQPNGVTIRVPVKLAHIGEFPERVSRLLPHLTIPVRVQDHAGNPVAVEVPKFPYSGPGWKLGEDQSAFVAVVGGVPYPVDSRQMTAQFRQKIGELFSFGNGGGSVSRRSRRRCRCGSVS